MKYDPLSNYLAQSNQDRIQLTFEKLESILSFSLPPSAKNYRAWWSNSGQSHSTVWTDAGYKVDEVNFTRQYVVFVKINATSNPPKPTPNKNPEPQETVISNNPEPQKTDIPRRVTDDIITLCGHTFTFLQELIPECDGDGSIKEYRSQDHEPRVRPLSEILRTHFAYTTDPF